MDYEKQLDLKIVILVDLKDYLVLYVLDNNLRSLVQRSHRFH
jgi:hypothetical protein